LTGAEFKSIYTGAFVETNQELIRENTLEFEDVGVLPASVDWRTKGAVTPVKNQGQCGSCWSFSTTGVIEGFYFLNNGKLLSFSEQQIVSCDTADGNQGCNGGWPYNAVTYSIKTGLELESNYPYKSGDGDSGTCRLNKAKVVSLGASAYKFVTPNSTIALQTAIVSSPVSVLIEADQDVFQSYSKGVIVSGCGNQIDHAVLAVGYAKVGNVGAFIVKNSWGADWGLNGYVYISTNGKANQGTGVCGILTQPLVVAK